MTESRDFTITLLGDLMLGRLIDQLLPTHVEEPEEADIVSHFRQKHAHLQEYTHRSPWGNSLDLIQKSDLVLGNLETSMTTHNVKWPDKVFNYRMHPDNVKCLTEAGIDYVSLANNHTLDFCKEGLFETIATLKSAGIAFAGAGLTPTEALQPAELTLPPIPPPPPIQSNTPPNDTTHAHRIHIHAFSDHPSDWQPIPEFNHITHTPALTLNSTLQTHLLPLSSPPSLLITSLHWGPNYTHHPSTPLRTTAHTLIDTYHTDIVWGHSAHHLQGVEVHNGKLVIYGCGDFVDDYAVNKEFRSDLGAVWNIIVVAGAEPGSDGGESGGGRKLVVKRLEVWPSRIRGFRVEMLGRGEPDHAWVVERFRTLCKELGTVVRQELGKGGQIIVDVNRV